MCTLKSDLQFPNIRMLMDEGETIIKPLVVQLCLVEKSIASANNNALNFFRAL